ncbi:hypothetical protein HK102_006268 [Quaeritorhiza haematococci]|nr:hypothetical protein HK102_006268 [Quaeritorhiza haematococci]
MPSIISGHPQEHRPPIQIVVCVQETLDRYCSIECRVAWILHDIPAPDIGWSDKVNDPLEPLQYALQIEKCILEDLHSLYDLADKSNDYALQAIIDDRFLKKKTKNVKIYGDLVKNAARVSKVPGHGLYHMDKELRSNKGRVPWSSSTLTLGIEQLSVQ